MPPDLDTVQKERIDQIAKQTKSRRLAPDEIFHCERVALTLPQDKIYLDSYRNERMLSVLPFAPVTYVHLCQRCVTRNGFDTFKKLVDASLVIPILRNPYASYPDQVAAFVASHDHISCYEYSFWRYARTVPEHHICQDCAEKRVTVLCDLVKGKRGAATLRRMVTQLRYNLSPYAYPDYELFDAMAAALAGGDRALAGQLVDLSYKMHRIRCAEAINAPVLIDSKELEGLPTGITSDIDAARRTNAEAKQLIADGLGVTIPLDVPIDRFIELVKDYQPQITEITTALSLNKEGISLPQLQRAIENLNREIDRIKGLKRLVALEAGISLFQNHKALMVGGLMAAALGLVGSFVGCAVGAGVGVGLNVARKKGLIKPTEKAARLGRMIARDVQPVLDNLIAKYLETTPAAVGVLTLRKKIEAARIASPSKAVATHPATS